MKRLFLCCGIPGSGKSTWVRNRIAENGGYHISRDAIRFATLKEGEHYFAKENMVYTTFIKKIQEALDDEYGHTDVYADATHLNEKSRNALLDQLDLTNVEEIILLYFRINVELALTRNSQRIGRENVPEEVVRSMEKTLRLPIDSDDNYVYTIWRVDENGDISIFE